MAKGTEARRHEGTEAAAPGTREITLRLRISEAPAGQYGSESSPIGYLGMIRSLTPRQGRALSLLYHGCIGQPLHAGLMVNSHERAIKMMLDRIADAAGVE